MAKNTNSIPDDKIPEFARQCWADYRRATQDQREREKESLGFWVGGKYQWRQGETEFREGTQRPWLTLNRCKPAVDLIENEARQNPPGPQALPVGGGADKDGADILEGIIREYSYRSAADIARITALRYAAGGGSGCYELGTEYAGEKTMAQRLVVLPIEDPSCVFYDPTAKRSAREDAMWQGKLQIMSRDTLMETYGKDLKILNRDYIARWGGWISDSIGWENNVATSNIWAGGVNGQGPYYICQFWRVLLIQQNLQLWTDHVARFEGESSPKGHQVVKEDGKWVERPVQQRQVWKYIVTAHDMLEKTRWYGTIIPIFWVMGPEIWRDGKLHRLSLITTSQDAQRGLNYAASSIAESIGTMNKTPWLGPEGTFDVTNAEGLNPWLSVGTTFAYMEYKPVWSTNPSNPEQSELAPPPQRNAWEAAIARMMEACTFFAEQIKAQTSVFFDPSLRSAQQAQSGKAIQALQQQTNVGTINWQDNLHRAVQIEYQQAAIVAANILDGPRVQTIVRPDTQHEVMEINREFPAETHDYNPTSRSWKEKNTGAVVKSNSISGDYMLRAKAGKKFEQRAEEALDRLLEVFQIAPQLLGAPGVAPKVLRLVGEGTPIVEQIADALEGGQQGEQTPEAMQQQLQQAQQHIQVLTILAQKMQMAMSAKLPELEAKKWIAAVNAITTIRAAEIKAGVDRSQIDLNMLEHLTGIAHEAGMQAADQEHERQLAAGQQQADAASQVSDQAHQQGMQASDQAATAAQQEAEPVGAAQ